MKRLHQISFTTETLPRQPAPQARPGAPTSPQPRDEMWRSRRVLSGSDWMEAWVQAPKRR